MFEELRALIPPPESPIDIAPAQVKLNESALGIRFPSDYLAFGSVYGTGRVFVHLDEESFYFWHIVSPGCSRYLEFVKKFSERHIEERDAYESFDLPLGIFPESGGLLPFAHRDDLYFTWKTVRDPNDWTVVAIWAYDEGGYMTTDLSFSDFLVFFLTRKLVIKGYEPWSTEQILFRPEEF